MRPNALFSLPFLIACNAGEATTTSPSIEQTPAPSTSTQDTVDFGLPGDLTAGQLWGETTGTTGELLYISTWYPSTDAGQTPTSYGWIGWYNDGTSYSDVAPACDSPRPVMVHSHGNMSLSWEMYWLPEFLATHGWIVVAPDHTGNTAYDYSADHWDLTVRRPQDIQDTFDWLLDQSDDPDHPLAGCVDPDAGYLVSGFSFGGYTAYATAGAQINDASGTETQQIGDDRVTGVVAFAPWDGFGALTDGTSMIEVPVLTLGGQRDATVGTQYLSLHAPIDARPKLLGDFDNAGHLSYTPIYCFVPGDGCGSSFIDQDLFTDLLATTVLSWAEYLRGDDSALDQLPGELDGELTWSIEE